MRFRDLRLGVKQSIGFGSILLIAAVVHFYSINRMSAIKDEIDRISNSWLPRAMAIAEANLGTAALRTEQLQHAVATSEEEKQLRADRMVALIDRINNSLDTYADLRQRAEANDLYGPKEAQLYAAFDGRWDAYQELFVDFFRLSLKNERQQALDLLNGDMGRIYAEFSADLEALVRANRDNTLAAAQRAETAFRATRAFTSTLLLATVLLSAFIGAWLVRYIAVPVQELEQAAQRVAEGDTGVRLEIGSSDEIGNLAHSFNQMTIALRDRQEEVSQANRTLAEKNSDLEETLRKLQEAQQQLIMQEKMASLGNLVAGVAHEINNPIGAINSASNTSARSIEIVRTAFEKHADTLADEKRLGRALEVLSRNNDVAVMASERIGRIVRSLRNFARLDEAEFQSTDLHEGLDSTLTLLDHVIKNRIEVIREYGDLPQINCFANQLNQVFMNIINNAAQAIDGSGKITLRTRLEEGEVKIEVTDTGKGIAPEHLERIFDPGFTTKGVGVGTGLGLSICYNIMRQHRGRMEAESEIGKGTTMRIVLPNDLQEPAAEKNY
ncbi:MAG: two-component system NtrC family sensor kinase [Candidatus Latescibacterota bacterium]|jgi:two-component system NtrC family sensor kinase